MSLINEALKRAEQDKLRHMQGEAPAAPPPADNDAAAAVAADDSDEGATSSFAAGLAERFNRLGRAPKMALAATVIALGLGGAIFWAWQSQPQAANAQLPTAPAVGDVEPLAVHAAASRVVLADKAEAARSDQPAQPGDAPVEAPVVQLAAVPEVAPTLPSAAPKMPAPVPAAETPAPDESGTGPASPEVTPADVESAATSDPAEVPAEISEPPTTQPEEPAVPQNPLARFNLGGIMWFAGEASATINGQLLRPGDTILGAKVIEIGSQSVILEIDGEQHMLGL